MIDLRSKAVTLFQRDAAPVALEKRPVERNLTGIVLDEREIPKQMTPRQKDYNQSETQRAPVLSTFSPPTPPMPKVPIVVKAEIAQPSENLTDSTEILSEQQLTAISNQNVRSQA